MNDYGFDYMNYITNLPSNMMKKMDNSSNNYMNQMNKMNLWNKMVGSDDILEPYEGLKRGNMFGNLYDPYKNYKPRELDPKNEREALLYQLMQYKFALIELNLHLDTHPNDREAIELFNKYLEVEKKMCEKYESMYGPLVVDSMNDESSWKWIKSPWPWEVM